MRKIVLTGFLAGLTCLISISANAQIYQWHDEQGSRHYGDHPPPSVDAQEIRATPPTNAQAGTSVQQRFSEQLQSMQRPREGITRDRNRPDSGDDSTDDALARDCERARNQLTALESGRPLSRTNADGQRERLDDETRSREKERTQRFIDNNCR